MLMGKGGVGKTTLAAAVAVELARRGLPVHLTTSDPAAHLAETLHGTLEHLTVSRIDPQEVTEAYRAHVLATKGAKLDAAGRAVLEEDLRSPCTEEIAVFQAFSRIIREAGKKFVVMDTAPTGHTLLLLDATGAYHRDIVRQMGSTGVHFTTPMMQLQDPKQTKVLLVTLAETTPVLEAANLQADLRRAGIEPWAWIINNSVAAACVTSPLLRQRARNELQRDRGRGHPPRPPLRRGAAAGRRARGRGPPRTTGHEWSHRMSVQCEVTAKQAAHAPMSVFERYLTVWVFLCIVAGIALGQLLPGVFQAIGGMEVAKVNLPVGLLIWVMIIPMLVKVDFGALHEVRQHMRGIGVTLFVNWLVKPFSMAFLGWLFIRHLFAPCCRPTSSTATSPA
jgi:hypothetical protein